MRLINRINKWATQPTHSTIRKLENVTKSISVCAEIMMNHELVPN